MSKSHFKRPLEFNMECDVYIPFSQPKKELVTFGVFENSINIKHGDNPEIIIDRDIAITILKKIVPETEIIFDPISIPKPIKVNHPTDETRIML